MVNKQVSHSFVEDDVVLIDGDGRATKLRPLTMSSPHMRTFHLAWLSLFACFFAAFAAPPILPTLSPVLVLSPSDPSAAAVASLAATLVGRLSMGPVCDLLGPRRASGAASLLTAAALALAAVFASSPTGFMALRFIAGLSLANFVANQHWMSSIFSPSVVGLANAVAAGWANVGSAAAQLVMPLAYTLVVRLGIPITVAWRVTFLLPAAMQIATGLAVLAFPYDLPCDTRTEKAKNRSFWKVVKEGLGNYRVWVLGLTYGYCYGVELIMENVAAEIFRKKFRLDMEAAGAAAACFGVMNAVARPAGGMASDAVAKRFGMRGRLWALWAVQSGGALLCVLLGRMGPMASLPATLAVMVACAVFVQSASGLTFGVVPFVSKRTLGVISGMTASGGALGAIVTNRLFFSSSKYTVETGISLTGLMSLVCTLPVALLHFPHWGGMLCAPSCTAEINDVNGDDDDDDDGGDGRDDVKGDYMLLK